MGINGVHTRKMNNFSSSRDEQHTNNKTSKKDSADSSNSSNSNSLKEIESHLSQVEYDKAFKTVFTDKRILSAILLNIVEEYQDLTFQQVLELVQRIEFLPCESVEFPKSTIYDIIVRSEIPYSITKNLIETHIYFNLEMQRMYDVPYSIESRAVYYASKILASQLDSKTNYRNLEKVYSTWICLYGYPDKFKDTIFHYFINGEVKYGTVTSPTAQMVLNAQLIDVSIIMLSKDMFYRENDLLNFLKAVFSKQLNDTRFNKYFQPDSKLLEGVDLVMGFENKIEEEIMWTKEQGKAEGRAEGKAEGKAEGRVEGRLSSFKDLVDKGIITEKTAAEQLNVTVEEFWQLVKKNEIK